MNKQFLKTAFLLFFVNSVFAQTKLNVLVFSKTAAFRHQSIEAGKKALEKMSRDKGFGVSFTEDASQFTEANLKKFNTVIFLNTTGDILNNEQQSSFERYIQAGGGYVGIHAATDTEYDWPWYNKLAGAWFLDHPMPNNVQKGKFFVTKKNELTAGMPDEFERSDEFYSFKDISPKINVVLKIDEKSYQGGKNGDNHPISWYQEFEGGRSFYTAMGHTDETFSEPIFLNHLYAGIKYASGGDGRINVGKGNTSDFGDLVYLGTTQPRYVFGTTLGFNFKGFDFTAFIQGVGKRSFRPETQTIAPLIVTWKQALGIHRDYWTPENPDALYPRPFQGGDHNYRVSDKWLLNGRYARLKNLQVGYTIPEKISSRLKISRARIFFSAQDILTFSKLGQFKGYFDPEQRDNIENDYPFFATASAGINLNF